MDSITTLDRLPPGKKGRISHLLTQGNMRRRLLDIGFTNQTVVECLYQSAAGDPTAYGIRGTVIALRRKDAESVCIHNI